MKRLCINIYNQRPIINYSAFSIEHIIPKSLFKKTQHSNHWMNTISCDRFTNSIRSNYRLDSPKPYKDLFLEFENKILQKEKIIIMNKNLHIYGVTDNSGYVSGIVNKKKKIFIPSIQADLVLISRSILFMLDRYPYLYNSLQKIVDIQLLEEYYNVSPSPLSLQRYYFYKTRS